MERFHCLIRWWWLFISDACSSSVSDQKQLQCFTRTVWVSDAHYYTTSSMCSGNTREIPVAMVDWRNFFSFSFFAWLRNGQAYRVHSCYFLIDHITVTSPVDESLIRWCHSTNRWRHYFWLKALNLMFPTRYGNHMSLDIVVLWTEKQIVSLSDFWNWWRKLYIHVNYWQTVDWIKVLIISPSRQQIEV